MNSIRTVFSRLAMLLPVMALLGCAGTADDRARVL